MLFLFKKFFIKMKSAFERTNISSMNLTNPSSITRTRYFEHLMSMSDNFSSLSKSDYNQIKQTLKQWTKTKYNSPDYDELAIIEKQIRRGQGLGTPEPKLIPKRKLSYDSHYQSFTKEHKIKDEGTHIMKLPKQPYGIHHTYNEEKEFIKSHFIEESNDMPLEKVKEIEVIKRKFRLQNKRYGGNENHRRSLSPSFYANLARYDRHLMRAGTLVCQKETVAVIPYEREKQRFDTTISSYKAAFKPKMSEREKAIESRLCRKSGSISNDVKNRIYASVSLDCSNRRSSSLISKYSPLFEEIAE